MNNKDVFIPVFFARNPFLQTVYSSLKIRNTGNSPVDKCAQEMIIDAGNGVRLQGYLSRQKDQSRGLVLLIHGWEGSSNSSYVVSTSNYLYQKGFDIFRLNMRDHGESHHLNEDLFNSSLIDEVFCAIKKVSRLFLNRSFFIIGYSLGGNFVLRVALKSGKYPINNLKHVVAISPVLDPAKAGVATDGTYFIRNYFVKKWKRSLNKKQVLYPDKYNFKMLHNVKTLDDITNVFVPLYTPFKNSTEYYKTYTLNGDSFKKLKTPTTIITSEDDPIIPVSDFYKLKTNENMNIIIQPYGGHNGFFDFLPYKCWYEDKIYDIFSKA